MKYGSNIKVSKFLHVDFPTISFNVTDAALISHRCRRNSTKNMTNIFSGPQHRAISRTAV